MKNEQTIKDILDAVGGQDNVKNFEHCATRLRIILRDNSKVSKEKAENVTGSKGYFFNTGQHQFIFGTGKVNEVYSEFKQYTKMDESADTAFKEEVYSNMTPVQRVVRTLADILIPLIPALVTTGLLMGLRGLLVELGVEFSPFMLSMFQMLTDTAFAFLPVLIAYSATRKFGGNPIIGIVVGLMMVSPNLPNAWAVAGGSAEAIKVSFLGLNIPIVGYQGSIIPAIVAGYLISRIEKELRKVVPQIIDLIVTPFVTLTVTIFLMLFILGPITHTFEIAVSDFIVMLINAPLGIGYILFGALQQLLVITGLHHTLSIIELQLLADTGENVLNPLMTASMAGQLGAAISAALLMNVKLKRTNAISSSTSTLFGITEPLLFGVNLRSLRILVSGMLGGAVGGLLTYIFGLSATGMGITFIPGLLLYTSSFASMIQYLVVIVGAFVTGFIAVKVQSNKISEQLNLD